MASHARLVVLLLAGCAPAGAPAQGASSSPGELSPAPAASSAPAASAAASAPAASAAPVASAPAASASAAASAAPAASAPVAPEGMALAPAGEFTMGADDEGEMDERPAHRVKVKAFFLDLTEVTNEAYFKCVDAGVCRPHDKTNVVANKLGSDRAFRAPRQPISAVSWDDALAYCKWVGKRLPTEAEWEYASRGPESRKHPWGDAFPTREHAVFGEGTTAEVGSRPKGKGPFGHLDLAGNVWEWVDDFYDPYAYKRPRAGEGIHGTCDETLEAFNELRRQKKQGYTGSNPIPAECEKVLRGGAFNYNAKGLRSSNRVHHPGRFRLVMSGFRCARSVE